MTELESLKRTRSGLRARLSFMDRSIQELLQDGGKQFEVCAALTQMEAYWAKLQEVQGAIESYVEDDGALEKEVENAMAFETTVVDIRAKVQRYLHGSPKTTATPEVSAAGPNLPKWNLPKFSGDVLEFNSFWDQFEAGVHGRSDLSNVAKLVYLKSALCGEALEAVDGFHVTNANYPVVVETLRERFGRESLVVESHILSLLKLTKEEEAHGSSTLRELFDKMNRHVRALEAIGKSVEDKLTAEDILLVLFKQLLPPAVRKRWEQKTLTSADSESITLKTLFDFLRTEVDIEECTKHPALVSKTRTQRTQKNSNIKRNDGQYSAVALQAFTNRKGSCFVCDGMHTVHTCPTFLSMSPRRRLQVSRKNRLCFVCLELGHAASACKSQDRCSIKGCRKLHHRLLHGEADCSSAQVGLLRNHRMEKVFLQTARARISGGNGSSLVITCLFDAGAQRSFIRTALADDLGLRGTTERVAIHTFGSHEGRMEKTRRVQFSLQPLDRRGTRQWMEALCLPHLCQPLEANPPISSSWSHLQDLTLADQFPRGKAIVDVLIGLDYYHAFMSGFTKNGSPKEPVAVQSSFGWILSGPAGSQEKGVQNVFQVTLSDSADVLLKRIWSLDAIGLRDEEGEKPSQVMKRFQDSFSFDGQRYTVRLPWNSEERLPNNYRLALRRLELLENRLGKDARLARLYVDGMRSYVDNGFVERVEQCAATSGRHWYLPHHPVIKNESSTTKCRIVFDGSALYQGVSLNQFLEIGPPLQRDLVGILLRFRRFRYGIHGDIEEMFLQIALHEDDRDAVRFLWREKGAGTEPTVFRFTRLCFGLSCSNITFVTVPYRELNSP
ncbi:hypothetical protein M513_06333 [Trichuris suis]|uniref:DUF1758 domain-containing protein n=1 Tax=Trichuris suis TaxID=68888 RepID=A0A085M6J6_9BILA|nr:hypothetical protein M513_06333 [Trichuris suis]